MERRTKTLIIRGNLSKTKIFLVEFVRNRKLLLSLFGSFIARLKVAAIRLQPLFLKH